MSAQKRCNFVQGWPFNGGVIHDQTLVRCATVACGFSSCLQSIGSRSRDIGLDRVELSLSGFAVRRMRLTARPGALFKCEGFAYTRQPSALTCGCTVGKPAEKRGRKASGLPAWTHAKDSGVASVEW